jgi:GNAT superfamily N-acetyltransferase
MLCGAEEVTLAGGRRITLAPVTPASKPLIAAALLRLSPESSRRRFFTPRFWMSDAELDALTNLDGVNRFALGASAVSDDGNAEGLGIARYVRDALEPRAAEAAVVVVDAWQRLGLGKLLLRHLAAAALARGIDRLRGIVLQDNDPMLGLLTRYAPGLALIRADGHLQVEVRLDPRKLSAHRPVTAGAASEQRAVTSPSPSA